MSFIQPINDQLLSSIQYFLSGITNLSFAIYDSHALLIQPRNENRATAYLTAGAPDIKGHEEFIRGAIEKAVLRKSPTLFTSPSGKAHLFVPIRISDNKLVFISSAIVTEKNAFESMSASIKYFIEMFLRSDYKRNLYDRKYRWTKILSDILLNIKLPSSEEQVYSSVLDTILLFFDVDTASIMVQQRDVFENVMTSGRLRHAVKSLCIEKGYPMMSQCIEESKPVFIHDVREIHNNGVPNNIKSLHVFPFSCISSNYGLLILYNSVLSSEDSQDILEFCNLMTLVFENINLQNAYHQNIIDTEILSATANQLVPHLHDLDDLCEIILHKAIELVKAEKGSLMLPEDNSLVIKASEGVNKWLLQDVVVRKGEGVAGKVFKDGRPFFVKNLNEITLLDFKPKSRYKTDSFISVPLTFGSETIGVLNIVDKRTGEGFTEQDFHLVNCFSSYSSYALKISTDYLLTEQMKEQSINDSLTGLFNREHFLKRLQEEIHRSEHYGNIFSFAIIDIDDFRLFNETEGRFAGDIVLREIADIVRKYIRGYDILSRFGGEKLGIVMPHTDKNKAYVIAERIRNNAKASLMGRWTKFPRPGVTVSIGISSFPHGGNNIDELTESVDTALYKAKSMGKDKTVVYSLLNNDAESHDAI